MTYIDAQWAGHYQAGSHDKVWAAAVTDTGDYYTLWGRRDTQYQRKARLFATRTEAQDWYIEATRHKQNEGYVQVPFRDPAHGNIPTFERVLPTIKPSKHITPTLVLGWIEAVSLTLNQARGTIPAPRLTQALIEWQRIRTATALLMERTHLFSSLKEQGQFELAYQQLERDIRRALETQ